MNLQKKKLVIVNQDVGYLFIDLANRALEQYDDVVLVSGSVIELGTSLDPRVKVVRVTRYRRSSMLARLVTWVIGVLQILVLLSTRFRRHDVILSSNPPLNSLLSLLVGNKMGLFVLDLYPEALHKTGMVSERSIIVRLWGRLNASAYRRFRVIWALTPSMKTAIEEYGVHVTHAPAWASDFANDLDPDFLEQERLKDAWIVLYSGNLGREHELECLLDCAAGLADHDSLLFVIAGEGWKKKTLQERIAVEGLKNVRLLSKLPAPAFTSLLRHSRIGVVTQSARTADICIPSKTFNLLASGLPILGIGQPDSDFGILINGSASGRVFLPEQTSEMIQFISACWNDDSAMQQLRQNSQETAHTFTKQNAAVMIDQFVNLEKSALDQTERPVTD